MKSAEVRIDGGNCGFTSVYLFLKTMPCTRFFLLKELSVKTVCKTFERKTNVAVAKKGM